MLRLCDCCRALLEETEQLALAVAWLRKQVGASYAPVLMCLFLCYYMLLLCQHGTART